MSLPHGILGFLNYGKMTGYDLAKAFDSSVGFFWYAQNSHIYLELNKLEKSGYVTWEYVTQMGHPNKKLYSITEEGRKELLRWLAEENPDFTKGMKEPFLVKLFFSANMPPQKSKEMLEKFIKDCENYLDSMKDIPKSIQKYQENTPPCDAMYWQFTVDFGYQYIQMCIQWAKGCIEKLVNSDERTAD